MFPRGCGDLFLSNLKCFCSKGSEQLDLKIGRMDILKAFHKDLLKCEIMQITGNVICSRKCDSS